MGKKEKRIMAKVNEVTIRIKVADYELEVQGPKKWAEKTIKEFIERIKADRG